VNANEHHVKNSADQKIKVAAFYQFADLDDFVSLREPLQACCEELALMGTILLAHEGINGTVAGPEQGSRAGN